ncbi:hypothetical protein P7C73_g4028, partial [Tremellales sp. Uapishka_1]
MPTMTQVRFAADTPTTEKSHTSSKKSNSKSKTTTSSPSYSSSKCNDCRAEATLPRTHLPPQTHHLAYYPPRDLLLPPPILAGPRAHPYSPAPILHNFGQGPTPLFGWESVMPLNHGYGQPKYYRYWKPDYRRFCYSVGKADVPYAALPGGPMMGFPTVMSSTMVGRW